MNPALLAASFASKLLHRGQEVCASLLLVSTKEMFRGINPSARQEPVENLSALGSENKAWHPFVFPANRVLVLPESLRWLAENAQIDINKQRRILVQRAVVMFGCQYQLSNRFLKTFVETILSETLSGQLCTALFVVGGARLIDSIVKPNCQFDCNWLMRQLARSIKLAETFGDVPGVVIMTMRLRVEPRQSFKPR